MRRAHVWIGAGLALALVGCPQGPTERTPDACAQHASCGVCASQPQCGWCMEEGSGRCMANPGGEEDPSVAPDGCGGTWHFLIADDPELPAGTAPYCAEEIAPGDDAGGDETDALEDDAVEGEEAVE